MADNLIILEEAEGIEDILKFSVGSSLYDHLVTAIGVVGGQLGWSRWLEVFKNQRLSYTPQPHFLSPTVSCRSGYESCFVFIHSLPRY